MDEKEAGPCQVTGRAPVLALVARADGEFKTESTSMFSHHACTGAYQRGLQGERESHVSAL